MSSVTKAKINLKDGVIELEGSESFVTKQLEVFGQQIKEMGKPKETQIQPSVVTEHVKEEGTPGKKKAGKSVQMVIPIPLDLKAKDDNPSLRDFYNQKRPNTMSESVVVFAYYLKQYLKIEKMEAGHVVFCCREVGIKVPESITQMFYDVNRFQGWLNLEEGRKLALINTSGENFVIHDLPRKEDAKADKGTT
jgi:hypothetical protein